MYRPCTTYAENSACVGDLVQTCESLLAAHRYSERDARSVAVNNIAALAKGKRMILNLFENWKNGDDSVRGLIPRMMGITPLTSPAVQLAVNIMNDSNRLAFCLIGQFQIENLLRNICRELGLPVKQGFYNVAETLLNRLALSSQLATLNVPALIRNSMHANGIHHGHKGSSTSITVRGVPFEFSHGKPVKCASWEHIAHALEASVLVLGEVIRHPAVAAIRDPMKDVYVWEMAVS